MVGNGIDSSRMVWMWCPSCAVQAVISYLHLPWVAVKSQRTLHFLSVRWGESAAARLASFLVIPPYSLQRGCIGLQCTDICRLQQLFSQEMLPTQLQYRALFAEQTGRRSKSRSGFTNLGWDSTFYQGQIFSALCSIERVTWSWWHKKSGPCGDERNSLQEY